MRHVILPATVALALTGCGWGEGVGSWRDAMFGLATDDEEGPLGRILESAEDTPGNQGLLYVAVVDAEAASQSATRAAEFADQPAEVANALGEVIYAIAPAAAPDWGTKVSGLVPGWRGTGYGLIRASEEIAENLRLIDGAGGPAADALICVEHTLELARQTLELARTMLADPDDRQLSTVLPEIRRLAAGQLYGLDADEDGAVEVVPGECALSQTIKILDPLRFDAPEV